MKVLFINAVCGTGSTGVIITDLAKKLISLNHDARIVFGVGERKRIDEKYAVKINNRLGYIAHNAVSRITDRTGLYSVHQTKNLLKYIDSYKPDLIHIHNLHGYYINYKILFDYLKNKNIPIVWTLHDCWAFTGHCAHFVQADCNKWQDECFDCPLLLSYPTCYTKGNVKDNFHTKKQCFTSVKNMHIVTPSRWLENNVKKSFLKKYPVSTINNGIDTNIFKPVKSDIKRELSLEGKKLILAVSNVWSKLKGIDDIIEISKQLDDSYRIVVVGLTDEQLKELPKNITGIKRTQSQAQLCELYSACDVFINPTYEDTFPTVNLEALACGAYVVTYDVCGCRETLYNGYGKAVAKGDTDALVTAIKEHTADTGAKKVDFDNSIVSNELSYEKYLDLYDKILG